MIIFSRKRKNIVSITIISSKTLSPVDVWVNSPACLFQVKTGNFRYSLERCRHSVLLECWLILDTLLIVSIPLTATNVWDLLIAILEISVPHLSIALSDHYTILFLLLWALVHWCFAHMAGEVLMPPDLLKSLTQCFDYLYCPPLCNLDLQPCIKHRTNKQWAIP